MLLVVLLDSDDAAPAGSPRRRREIGSSSPRPPPRGARSSADVAVGGGVAAGLVGGWSPAARAGRHAGAYHRWAARLGRRLAARRRSNDYGPGRVEVGLAVARLALCPSTGDDRSRCTLALYVQQQVGWMRGRGVDYEAGNRVADRLWLATGAVDRRAGGPLGRIARLGGRGRARSALLQEARFVDRQPRHRVSSRIRSAFMTTLAFTTRVW